MGSVGIVANVFMEAVAPVTFIGVYILHDPKKAVVPPAGWEPNVSGELRVVVDPLSANVAFKLPILTVPVPAVKRSAVPLRDELFEAI